MPAHGDLETPTERSVSTNPRVFSSSDLPEHLSDRDRFRLWNEIYRDRVRAVNFSTSGNLPFSMTLKAIPIGSLTYSVNEGTVSVAERGKAEVSSIDTGIYTLCINLGTAKQDGIYGKKALGVPPGAAFLDAEEPLIIGGGPDYNRWAAVTIPQTVLDTAFTRVGDRQGLSIAADTEALRLMRSYMQMLDVGPVPDSPVLSEHIAQTMIDLVALATGIKGDEAELAGLRGLRAARLRGVLDHLKQDYTTPGLSARDVGQRLGLSERYVQDLLAATGISLSDRLLELRLQHARKLLSAEGARPMRIADIIYDSGFGDVSYFNRCFRRRFGCSPGSVR